jgi:hypothetical protein
MKTEQTRQNTNAMSSNCISALPFQFFVTYLSVTRPRSQFGVGDDHGDAGSLLLDASLRPISFFGVRVHSLMPCQWTQ